MAITAIKWKHLHHSYLPVFISQLCFYSWPKMYFNLYFWKLCAWLQDEVKPCAKTISRFYLINPVLFTQTMIHLKVSWQHSSPSLIQSHMHVVRIVSQAHRCHCLSKPLNAVSATSLTTDKILNVREQRLVVAHGFSGFDLSWWIGITARLLWWQLKTPKSSL